MRSAVAAAREAMGWKVDWGVDLGWKGSPELRAIEAVERWIVDPTDENARTANEVRAFVDDDGDADPSGKAVAWSCGGDKLRVSHNCAIEFNVARHHAGGLAVRAAIQRELVPWALGDGDAVLARVHARSKA